MNVAALNELEGALGPEELEASGLVKKGRKIKILGDGDLTRALNIRAHKFSKSARQKIEAAGGTCEEISS